MPLTNRERTLFRILEATIVVPLAIGVVAFLVMGDVGTACIFVAGIVFFVWSFSRNVFRKQEPKNETTKNALPS
jgi:hypothetical protein